MRGAIAIERATLYWLVTRGIDELTTGAQLLARVADELAVLYRKPAGDRELVAGGDGGKTPAPSTSP